MLKIKSITLEDFGPFKGDQTMHFPDKDGVVVVYGENMRGKTILLNAIRYALFGKVRSRGARDVSLHLLTNWEKAATGHYGFKVILTFTFDGLNYELTRNCRPRDSSRPPTSDQDYTEESFLREADQVLGPGDRDTILSRIMPEAVSRFFLFDGELLQEYEELLREESEMGEKIKQAIERILGVPILTNARMHLRSQLAKAQKLESKAASEDQKTSELGNHLSELSEKRTVHETEIERFSANLEDLKAQRSGLLETMRRDERTRFLLEQSDVLTEELREIEEDMDQKYAKIQGLMTKGWLGLLKPRISALLHSHQSQLAAAQEAAAQQAADVFIQARIHQAIEQRVCPICLRELDAHTSSEILKHLGRPQGDASVPSPSQTESQALLRSIAFLQDFVANDQLPLLTEILQRLSELMVRKHTTKERLTEIKDRTKDADESRIRGIHADYSKLEKDIALVEDGLAKERQKLQEDEAMIKKLQDKLDQLGGASTSAPRRKRELCEQLVRLLDDSVASYRNRLRLRVERDATLLFQKLTSEPDYAGLRINESYGLSIIHRDSQPIPVRSAGAEHVVALSLMGALQRNSPLHGPLIMDSPFGRLDEVHTTRVVQALPSMAQQVVLLVFESEIPPRLARDKLLGHLVAEFKLTRKSARHTTIDRLIEAGQ